jgi:carboxymethylenebutenolidase
MDANRVSFPVNGEETQAYLAIPEGGSGPGVIVIQEWWGLVPHIEEVCNRFAGAGFAALAPDLYHGKSTTSPDEAGKLMMAINIAETEKDLAGAARFLGAHQATTGDKIGVVGFCMGGQLALYAASRNPAIGACVNYYGVHPEVHPEFQNIKAPVLGFFAEKDAFVNPRVVKALEEELVAAGVSVDFHTYPGTDHAFFNDTRPEVYVEDAAKDSWNRMLELFRSSLL